MSKETMKQRVLKLIYHTKFLASTSQWISEVSGINERTVREIIEDLRGDGHLICNDQDGKGYYFAESYDDVLRQYRRDCRRAMSILRRIKAFRRYLREAEQEQAGQLTIEEWLVGDAAETIFSEEGE